MKYHDMRTIPDDEIVWVMVESDGRRECLLAANRRGKILIVNAHSFDELVPNEVATGWLELVPPKHE